MGGNVSGSAAPSGTSTGTQSSMPTGGKGSNGPIQPYQGGQQAQPNLQPQQSSPLGLFSAGPATDPSPFMQQQNQQQNYGGAFGLGQTGQSGQQQYNPQQMGLQGLLGGYGKGGGGAMPGPYQQQGGMPMQQQPNPASDMGMVGPRDQQSTQPQTAATTPSFYGQQPTQPDIQSYTDNGHFGWTAQQYLNDKKGIGGYGDNDQMSGGLNPYSNAENAMQQAQQQALQQAPQQMQQPRQAPVQQLASGNNMFYNMSAADIDKFNASHNPYMKKGGRVK